MPLNLSYFCLVGLIFWLKQHIKSYSENTTKTSNSFSYHDQYILNYPMDKQPFVGQPLSGIKYILNHSTKYKQTYLWLHNLCLLVTFLCECGRYVWCSGFISRRVIPVNISSKSSSLKQECLCPVQIQCFINKWLIIHKCIMK